MPKKPANKKILLDARVHCAVLNVRTVTSPPHRQTPTGPSNNQTSGTTDRKHHQRQPPTPPTHARAHSAHTRGTSQMARSLRTQQRAYHHQPHPIPFPTTASKDTGTY
jgi:hypothetical protein